ncbi:MULTISPECIES: universal stress protein [unclassified Mycobacterium]|uniref:universal stress protein n=1 Tax=unclassified Mycobacterium TaxID=2642494 RepID=UPI0007FF0475|nr:MULTISPECIES: universal stress protein [unclassified Mycobacterium]OBB37345.1 universal stress protein UspA [Mycobacterium sp. 852002-51961_SCH5331710]OBH01791.1 universal stress protein UspA [Mycobacterium sp. E136]
MAEDTKHRGIVVGADGSASAKAAIGWAAREASMRRLPLTVVHANSVSTVAAAMVAWPGGQIPQQVLEQQEDEARAILAEAVALARETAGSGAGLTVIDEMFFGWPVPTLVDVSKEAEMVVVGCRGRTGLRRALLGSVSSGLIHHGHCPVAVVHDGDASSSRLPVLVGIDGSRASEAATAIAFAEASWRGVDLVALHVWSDADMPKFSMDWTDVLASTRRTLSERLAGWRERYPDVEVTTLVELEGPARQLLELSERAQLVVVGSHGRGGFTGMLLGSVSTVVAAAARVPVIVARGS